MNIGGNTVLVTGGSSGIGFALAERFAKAGSEVVVTGRNAETLREARRRIPGLHAIVSDVGDPGQRQALAEEVLARFPRLNVLVNNAGIQTYAQVLEPPPWEQMAREIDINLGGPIHLTMLLTTHLAKQAEPRIINVSSGLAFAPLAPMPVYCATKAALHSFTLALRYQLRETPVSVIEIAPPAVKTNLGGAHAFGEDLDVFADAIVEQLKLDAREAGFGMSAGALRASREQLDEMFETMNDQFARMRAQ